MKAEEYNDILVNKVIILIGSIKGHGGMGEHHNRQREGDWQSVCDEGSVLLLPVYLFESLCALTPVTGERGSAICLVEIFWLKSAWCKAVINQPTYRALNLY